MSEQGTTAISRRRVVQGLAWATPAIVIATSAPAAAANSTDPAPPPPPTCDVSLNDTQAAVVNSSWAIAQGGPLRDQGYGIRETGWTPSNGSDPTAANAGWLLGSTAGFESSGDNTLPSSATSPTSGWTVLTAEYAFDADSYAVYGIEFDMMVRHGNYDPSQSSRQSVALTANGVELGRYSVGHGASALPPGNRTDAEMVGYVLQAPGYSTSSATRVLEYTATTQGPVVLRFTFTIEGIYPDGNSTNRRNVSDDIWVGQPVVTQIRCV